MLHSNTAEAKDIIAQSGKERGPITKLAALWFLLAIADTILLAASGNSVLHITQLSMMVRAAFVCCELLALAAGTAILACPLYLIEGVVKRRGISPNRRSPLPMLQPVICITIILLKWAPLLAFIASWIQFHSTGHFLDRESLSFFMTNSTQLLQHFVHLEPHLALAVPLIVVVIGLLLTCTFHRLNHLTPAGQRRIALYAVVLLIFLSIGALKGQISATNIGALMDLSVGTVYTWEELYAECRMDRSGPMVHAVMDLANSIWMEDPVDADRGVKTEWRTIIPMSEYLQGVNEDHFRRWNVIVVLVESLRPDQLRAGGSSVDLMPNLESIARSGRIYINNFSQASHSNYADPCPFSSHYPLRSIRTHLYPRQPEYPRVLIYDILKAAGYRTAIISSQDENWGAMFNYLNTGNLDHFIHAANFPGPVYVPHGDDGVENWIKGAKRSGKIDDRYTLSEAIRWSEPQNGEPFFIYINLQNSHVPYETPADFPRRFGPQKLPFEIGFNQFPVGSVSLVKQAYANSLAYVDFQLGKLIEALKSRGQWDRTILVVTGDNGQAFYEHGFAAHANKLFNEVIKVPIVIRAPGLEPGIDSRLSQHIDIPPTILSLLGLPPHPSFQGTSLLEANPSPNRSIYLVVQSPLAHQYAIVRNGMKLIYDAPSKSYSLFILGRDPGEHINVALTDSKSREELRKRLNTWRKVQIDYYSSPRKYTRWYPPILKD